MTWVTVPARSGGAAEGDGTARGIHVAEPAAAHVDRAPRHQATAHPGAVQESSVLDDLDVRPRRHLAGGQPELTARRGAVEAQHLRRHPRQRTFDARGYAVPRIPLAAQELSDARRRVPPAERTEVRGLGRVHEVAGREHTRTRGRQGGVDGRRLGRGSSRR